MPIVAKYVCATVVLVALLGGLIYLSETHGPPEAIASVGTAFGLAVSAVLPMITGKNAPKGSGPAAVALAALAALASEGCASTPLPPKDCTKVGFREGDEACMRQYTAEGERIACRRANAKACGVVFTPSPGDAK